MNGTNILRNAALVLGFAIVASTATAQTAANEANYLASADVEQVAGRMIDASTEHVDMVSKISLAASAVKGVEADAQIRESIARKVMQGKADAKVVRTVLSGDAWIVKVTEMGVPT